MRVVVVSPNSGRLEALRTSVAEQALVTSLSTLEGSLSNRAEASVSDNADVILVDGTRDAMDELGALESIQKSIPGVSTVFLAPNTDSEILLRALRLGIKEVLTPDTIEAELPVALARISEISNAKDGESAQTFAFVSAKGGSGCTFLAANFAHQLATITTKNVLLIDLDLRGGNAHLMLSARKPLVSIADMAREMHRVDASFLKSSMLEISPNLGVLAAPEEPSQASDVRAAHVESLIALAKKEFDYVVIDAGRVLNAVTVRSLDAADFVFPVCQLSVPFIREARRLAQAIRGLDYGPGKVKLLVNRNQKVRGLRIDDLEKGVGMPVHATIPNHYASVSESVNQGEPIAQLMKSSPVNKALKKLALEFTTEQVRSGWFNRVRSA